MQPLKSKRILLGVTGSIACYKAADLASTLSQLGAHVDVVLTSAATKFIAPLTFQSVTGRHAYTDEDLWGPEGHVLHVSLGKEADWIVIAPATANTLAKLAHGQADNLLTLAALASTTPLLLAPAMDGGMYKHPATQANLETLKGRGIHIIGPVTGHLASGLSGLGRMVEPAQLVGQVRYLLGRNGSLVGRKVLVTAGGTQEAIDPVRSITNRSSGKQGYALVQAALDMGAEVTLISSPTALEVPVGAKPVRVTSAEEMLEAVLNEVKTADALLMAAAVADFRPAKVTQKKIKRAADTLTIELINNPDILFEVSKARGKRNKPHIVVGFAAETEDLLKNAKHKVDAKNLDLIVANDIKSDDAGFEVDTNRVVLIDKAGNKEELPLMSKAEVAQIVLERVATLLS